MFDALYPEAADAAIKADAARAPAPRSDPPWFKGFWGAVGSAVPRAGAEMGRAMTSLMTPEAVGAAGAPTLFSAGPTDRPRLEAELKQQDAAIRDAIREFTPDAETTGVASMVLHDVTRFVGKAAAYSALGGAPGAVAGMTLDEGINEAQRRMDAGVDAATAAKLGAVKGVASGLAVVLPVAGKTIGQTLGLAVAGGPGAFIAEQATAREILQSADYSKEAAEIDPFDPLGLGVSFLGSAAFGAGALVARGTRGRAADAAPGQKAEPLPAAQRTATPEQVDAAHVSILQTQREAAGIHRPADLEAAAGHARALDTAAEQLAAGLRVNVADVAPVDAARLVEALTPAARAISGLDEATAATAVEALQRAGMGNLQMVDSIDQLPVTGRARLQDGEPVRGMYDPETDTTFLVRQNIASVDEAFFVGLHESFHRGLRKTVGADIEPVLTLIHDGNERVRTMAARYMQEQKIGQMEAVEEVLADMAAQAELGNLQGWDQLLAVLKDAVTKMARAAGITVEITDDMVTDLVAGVRRAGMQAPRAEAREAGAAQAAEPTRPAAEGAADPTGDYLATQTDRIAQTSPDMLVMLEGMDAPRPMSEVLAEIRAQADQEIADAPLLKVAAECALTA
jgi:hypothetical protein